MEMKIIFKEMIHRSDSGRIKRNGLNSFDVTYFIISYALFQIMDKNISFDLV